MNGFKVNMPPTETNTKGLINPQGPLTTHKSGTNCSSFQNFVFKDYFGSAQIAECQKQMVQF